MSPEVGNLSVLALEWHAVLLKILKRSAPATRITVDLDKEIRGMLRRNDEIEWDHITDSVAAIRELTESMFQFSVQTVTVEGTEMTRLTNGPLWQLVEATATADADWSPEDETTWVPETLTLEVGSWWRRPKDVTQHDPRQIRLFEQPDPADDIRLF